MLECEARIMKIPNESKRQAMDAISSAETIAQIGAVKLTGGIALYAARIREMDRESGFAPRKAKRRAFRSAIGRDI